MTEPLTPRERRLSAIYTRNFNPTARLADLKTPDGGYTVNPRTGKQPSQGISVSVAGHEEVHSAEDISLKDVTEYSQQADRVRAITADSTLHFGGWNAAGNAVMDLSHVYRNTEQGWRYSRMAAIRNNQEAVYNLGLGKSEYAPIQGISKGGVPDVIAEQIVSDYINDPSAPGSKE
jgi:hypothetical protein